MTLVDLRKLAIRKRSQIRFKLKNGLACVINETGVARVPDLKAVPGFNLEDELSAATEFVMEAVLPEGSKAAKVKPVVMNRDQIAAQLAPATVAAHDEHDDE
ncbi:MAG: hypothetical protein ABI806_16610 [Candidatus Solibacter sp.]